MKQSRFRLVEVESFPRPLQEGVVYFSERFNCAAHACACGCGKEVITPISPVQWRISRSTRGVSLSPSIGNWNFACRSHYWITDGRVEWAMDMTREEIQAGREYNAALREEYFKAKRGKTKAAIQHPEALPRSRGLFARFINWLTGSRR
ncbi:MAG TPA: DUF6527 family protein [Xanthomonadaceae bacterium]|jgi:hypothetical protein